MVFIITNKKLYQSSNIIKLKKQWLEITIKFLWRKSPEHSSLLYVWRKFPHLGYGKWLLTCVFVVLCSSQSGRVIAADYGINTSAEEAKTFNFDIPEQRADLSLIAFAEQSNMTLLFPFDEMKNRQANR